MALALPLGFGRLLFLNSVLDLPLPQQASALVTADAVVIWWCLAAGFELAQAFADNRALLLVATAERQNQNAPPRRPYSLGNDSIGRQGALRYAMIPRG